MIQEVNASNAVSRVKHCSIRYSVCLYV